MLYLLYVNAWCQLNGHTYLNKPQPSSFPPLLIWYLNVKIEHVSICRDTYMVSNYPTSFLWPVQSKVIFLMIELLFKAWLEYTLNFPKVWRALIHFWSMFLSYNPWKTKVFWCFQGEKMRALARNGLK